jgi:two-component system response regulator
MKTKGMEILLVEDNQSDAELSMMALKEAMITNKIVHLKDGEEALNYIFGDDANPGHMNEGQIGLILLDLKMPKVNGIEVLKRLKEDKRTQSIPVAVFTSSSEDPDVKECYRLNVNSYIIKPLDFSQLGKTIRDTGLYWLLINHLPDK